VTTITTRILFIPITSVDYTDQMIVACVRFVYIIELWGLIGARMHHLCIINKFRITNLVPRSVLHNFRAMSSLSEVQGNSTNTHL